MIARDWKAVKLGSYHRGQFTNYQFINDAVKRGGWWQQIKPQFAFKFAPRRAGNCIQHLIKQFVLAANFNARDGALRYSNDVAD